jgi:Ca2+-binding EF-hand superfamily protein
MLHCAAGASIEPSEDVWPLSEPVSSEARGAFLADLAARDDVSTEQLHMSDTTGRDAICLAIEQLGDASLQFVEAAVGKGYDVERELELPDEDLDLPYRPAWETPSDPPPGFAGDDNADLFDDLEEPAEVSPEPSEAEEPGEATVDALEAYLKAIFDRVDTDGSGAISAQEALAALRDDDDFAEVLGVEGRSRDDVLAAIEGMDTDGDDNVSWEEFRRAALGEDPEPSEPEASEEPPDIEKYLREIFDRADVDSSGEISTKEAIAAVENDDEFAEMLGFDGVTKIKKEDGTQADLEFAIAMLDADGNEKVSWGEFREAFLGPLTEEPEDPSASARESTCPNHAVDATPPAHRFEEYLNDYEAYLETVFDRVDKNKDGTLSYAELVSGLKDPEFAEEAGFYGSGMSRGEFAAEFCEALDWDGDRTVDWFEFRDEATTCVEINQCVRCTKSFLSDGAAALVPSSGEDRHAIEQASRR